MASKLNPNVLYVAEPGEPLGSPQDSERTHIAGEAGEESSDSDGEQEETSHKLIRKVSTSGQIRAKVGSDGVKECECV
ncbi:Diacylglycerol kinase eta [Dissostichus eleginoides]|uniref:Diacylglycerol kinase eta n=1 Tax=Dissostichus eleginoides TaxID=100907 RepID=A0AAD9BWA0_DISEL|nr:Diacylglycerol kinase eta [Dissostichus eleginoides]